MKLKLIIAVVVMAAVPLWAQAQPKAPKPTKADAQRVIKIVSDDKAKTKIYCDIAKLGEQIEQAEQKKDEKKVDALVQQTEEMGKKIGPEYVALMDGMQQLSEKEAEEIGTTLEALDKLCAK
jgi:hypothetical protein